MIKFIHITTIYVDIPINLGYLQAILTSQLYLSIGFKKVRPQFEICLQVMFGVMSFCKDTKALERSFD